MTRADSDTLLDPALDAVAQAMVICRHVQRSLDHLRAMTKDDRSPVTVADFASQAIVAAILRESLGELTLVGEESAAFLRQPEHAAHLAATVGSLRDTGVWPDATEADALAAIDLGAAEPRDWTHDGFWTLDPVDGTKGFLRAEQYCISLAFIRDGEVELGVLGCPNLAPEPDADPARPSEIGCIAYAVREGGAMQRWETEAATVEIELDRPDLNPDQPARLAESVESGHSNQEVSAKVMSDAGPTLPGLRIDSQCKYAVVARGQADVYLRLPTRRGYVERIWDHAAGSLVAKEAGCTVTDVLGRPLDYSQGRGLEGNVGILGAPPHLHARLLGALERLGVGRGQ